MQLVPVRGSVTLMSVAALDQTQWRQILFDT
jgi:hypothetical protein